MGLSSAMTTALTGLHAAETQIDVSGNNLANSQTVGFKASDVIFANQFLRTIGQGSPPSDNSGGTNPRQIGLGVQVAGITPDFSQGTIEISSSPSDLAIQGDGFFIVEGPQGEPLYTRNGIFTTNSENELVSATGNRLLGYGVDEFYQLQETTLVPLVIPLGSAAAAQATQNVYLNGNLTPTGDVATTAGVIDSSVLGDGQYHRPDIDTMSAAAAATPDDTGVGGSSSNTGTGFNAGDVFEYLFTFIDSTGNETMPSNTAVEVPVTANSNAITLTSLPGSSDYSQVNVYRRLQGATNPQYQLVGTANQGQASFADSLYDASGQPALDTSSLNGIYNYVITYSGSSGVPESRPSELLSPPPVVNGRIYLSDLPTIPTGEGVPNYDTINVYRSLASNPDQYYLVGSLQPAAGETDFTDHVSDAELVSHPALDMDGPKINNATRLVDVVRRDGLEYENLFEVGTLEYTGRKGGNLLTSKSLEVTETTTVADYLRFLEMASGIQKPVAGDPHPIPESINTIPGESGMLAPGGVVTADGRLRMVSNNGTGNALSISSSGFQLTRSDGTTTAPNLGFSSVQTAAGQSASTDFIVYDTLGIPLNVRLTAVLESRDGQRATYRWFADSGDNDPAGPDYAISVGNGLMSFDGEGNLIEANNPVVTIGRNDIPSLNPLVFNLDFSQLSGFASERSDLAASRQDGSPVGTLTSYSISEGGEIMGVFSNGIARTLGQIRLAQFANPTGLEQRGENMYGLGFNSGLPVEGNPGELGLGNIVAGALELSNTDTGENLIELLLASTQYRANSRVISTSQQLLDDLLNMRR